MDYDEFCPYILSFLISPISNNIFSISSLKFISLSHSHGSFLPTRLSPLFFLLRVVRCLTKSHSLFGGNSAVIVLFSTVVRMVYRCSQCDSVKMCRRRKKPNIRTKLNVKKELRERVIQMNMMLRPGLGENFGSSAI